MSHFMRIKHDKIAKYLNFSEHVHIWCCFMIFSLSWQKIARRVHLYLGISIGALLTLIALSGSILVYYPELDGQLNKLSVHSSNTINWDEAYATLKYKYPDRLGSWRLENTATGSVIPARYYKPIETKGQAFAPLMVWLNPIGTQIIRDDFWGNYFVTWVYNLHFSLLTGSTGTLIVGYIGIGTLILILSGLWAWWPKRGYWARSLKFKARSTKLGLLYDWHKFIGLCFILPLLVLTITGIMLAIPNQTDPIITALLGKIEKPTTTVIKPKNYILLSDAIELAQKAMPSARLAWIETPSSSNAVYRFRLQTTNDPSHRFPHSYVEINANSAEIISVFNVDNKSPATKVKNWLHPLHDGTIGNHPLRVLWVLSGIANALLFSLGLYRWLLKTRRINNY